MNIVEHVIMKKKLLNWIKEAQTLVTNYFKAEFPCLDIPKVMYRTDRKYFIITLQDQNFGFINKTTGDVYKTSVFGVLYERPSGNLSDKNNGLDRVDYRGVH